MELDPAALAPGDPTLASALHEAITEQRSIDAFFASQRRAPASATTSPFSHPDTVGPYRLTGLLGEGGMARVYLAFEPGLSRLVALKVLDPSLFRRDPTARHRFQREAELAAGLDHPHIAPIYAADTQGEPAWIAMKWLRGKSLHDLAGSLRPSEVARIGIGIAEALAHAHDHRVLHRDVKPSNIQLDDGIPYLLDFGLAAADQPNLLTEPTAIPGTLAYLAPERLRSPSASTPAADLYALGASLHEAIRGTPAFPHADRTALLHAVLHRPPATLNLPAPDRDLATIIDRCLAKEPSDRYSSARALAADLRCFVDGEPIAARPLSPRQKLWRRIRRRPRLAAGITALLVTALSLAGFGAWSAERRSSSIRQRIAAANAHWEQGRLDEASLLVTTLQHEGVDDPRLPRLALAVAAERAIEDLLDELLARSGALDETRIIGLIVECRRLQPHSRRPVAIELASPLAALLFGDRDLATRELSTASAEARTTRSFHALTALSSGSRWSPHSAPADRDSVDALIAALVARADDAPRADREALNLRLRERAPGDFRTGLVHALLHYDLGEWEAAQSALLVLNPSARSARWVRDLLSALAAARGDQTLLSTLRTELGHNPLTRQAALDDLLARARAARSSEVDAEVLDELRDFPNPERWDVGFVRARILLARGKPEAAASEYDRLLEAAPTLHVRALVGGEWCLAQSQRLLMGAMTDRASVETRAAELAQSAQNPVTRACALGLLGDLARSRNQRDQALAHLEAAARIVIPEPAPLLRLADLLNTEIWARGVPLLELAQNPSLDPFLRDQGARHAVDLCLQRIPTVVFAHEQGSATISDAQLDAALIYLITLRASRGHDAELRPWLIRVRERIAARQWTLPSVVPRLAPLFDSLLE